VGAKLRSTWYTREWWSLDWMKGRLGYIIKMVQFYQRKIDKLRGSIEKSNWICASLELEKMKMRCGNLKEAKKEKGYNQT
jgi:hypothetical protein